MRFSANLVSAVDYFNTAASLVRVTSLRRMAARQSQAELNCLDSSNHAGPYDKTSPTARGAAMRDKGGLQPTRQRTSLAIPGGRNLGMIIFVGIDSRVLSYK